MRSDSTFRPDIQGLRAVAVLLVLWFHIFPASLPGGYVGVDVFFVISGYLISGLLMKEATGTGGVKLRRFYERRIRRLMPAATIVIAASAAGTILFLPQTRWIDTAWQLLASAFYVENWYLYYQSVDYLRADTPPGPFQHFWSLSVEEQFYFGWPLLVLLGGLAASRLNLDKRWIWGASFALIFAGSLAASVLITLRDPPSAYFMLWTRIWELALGGLAALAAGRARLPEAVRAAMSWLGMAAIIGSALVLTEQSPFPGYVALVPTLGTAVLLVIGGEAGALSASPVLRSPIMRYVGDISYSLYLWHWPAVVFALAFLGKPFEFLEGLGVAGIAFALSAVSKTYVEDVFRNRKEGASGWRVVAIFGVCAAVSVASAFSLYLPATQAVQAARSVEIDYGDYPGAAALYADAAVPVPQGAAFIPDLALARSSLPDMYGRNCHVAKGSSEIIPCVFPPPQGAPASDFVVMLVGDSHAGHWLPALQDIALRKGWTIISHTKSSCPFLDADLVVANAPYPECREWGRAVASDIVARKPDLVVTAMITNHFAAGASGNDENQRWLADGLKRA